MKKRVVFYQRLAAAFLLFSLATGIYAFYPKTSGEQIAKTEVRSQETEDKGQESEVKSQESGVKGQETEVRSQESGVRGKETEVRSRNDVRNEDVKIAQNKSIENARRSVSKTKENPADATTSDNQEGINSEKEESLIALESPTETISPSEETTSSPNIDQHPAPGTSHQEETESTVAVVSPLLQTEPEEVVAPKKRSRESNLWLALGASAGNYTPNTPSATTTTAQSSFGPTLDNLSNAQQAEPKIGTSYSFGMAVGKKFGRVVVQTGVNLNKQSVEYSSNYDTRTTANNAKAASSDYLLANSSMSFTNTYTVNSSMEIVSIPVQAGYMIIDRKLGWQLNAGVSPDFFIRNILVDESGQRERFTQGAGSASPYRSVNWSGLLNTELSYRIGDHYRLSVVPGVRYSFNPLLKDSNDSGRPMILDVGFRFRYLFE